MICEYESNIVKFVCLLQNEGVKVTAFEPETEDADAGIDLSIPNRKVSIQLCPYDPENGYTILEALGSGKYMYFKWLKTFPMNKEGFSNMISFIKELK